MKNGKLVICCGHGEYDPGAINGEYKEAAMVRSLATALVLRCADDSKIKLLDTSIDHYKHRSFRTINISTNDQVVELHMDGSTNKNARGSHVIINSMYEPDGYDTELAKKMSILLPGRSSIIVKKSDLANCNDCADRGIPYRILELGFITNNTDLNFVKSNLTSIADTILSTFDIRISNENPSYYNDKLKDVLTRKFGEIFEELKE